MSASVHLSYRIIFPTGPPDPDPRTHPPVLISHLISSHFFSILRCIAYSAQRKERIESCKDRYHLQLSFPSLLICSPPCSTPITLTLTPPFPVPSQTYFHPKYLVSHTLLYPSHNPATSRKRFSANHPKTLLFRIEPVLCPQTVIALTKRSASTSATASSTPRHLAKRTAYIKRNDVWVFPPHL